MAKKLKTHVFVRSEGEAKEAAKELDAIDEQLKKLGYKKDSEESRGNEELGFSITRRQYIKGSE